MDIDYRWVVDEVTDGYRWVSYAGRRNRHVVVTLVRALVYCNFLKEVRLGGWGSEGPKGPTLGQYVSACATILLGSGRI